MTRARRPRPIAPTTTPSAPARVPFRFVLFTDLHVSAKTLDRALDLLHRVGDAAREHKAEIVCLGDFWDLRGVLSVRHVDAVLDAIESWGETRAWIIPGNHDQVTIDGSVHGVRIFASLRNVKVATDLVLDEERDIAFVPWREGDGAQEAIFARVPEGWTVFAHAEVQGATANNGHPSAGRVSGATVERARAAYLGHYHMRQRIGGHTWYIGSPFEMDVGERDTPHGIALVTDERAEPTWLDLDHYPKHRVLTWPFDEADVKGIRAQDIVEVRAPRASLDSARTASVLALCDARDIRQIAVPETGGEEGPPKFALTLDDALTEYVSQEAEAGLPEGWTQDDLARVGRDVLARVPDARVVVPAGAKVRILSVLVTDFMAVRGTVSLPLAERGTLLLRGRMGIGKTSLADAVTWGLFGVTAPRKAGAAGASLRADDVVHDAATIAKVTVALDIDGVPATVTRSKKRGKTAEIKIDYKGALPAGISDQQQQVQSLVGLTYDLWRSCVYLGQGAVATFLTDADKRRKEVLSTAFSLGACADALKIVRSRAKDVVVQTERLKLEVAGNARALSALAETDYAAQIADFESRREAAKAAMREAGEAAKAAVAQCDATLEAEEQWVRARAASEERLGTLVKSFGASYASTDSTLMQRVGGLRAELGILQRDRAKLAGEREKLTHERDYGLAVCAACHRPMDLSGVETRLSEMEIKGRQFDVAVTDTEAHLSQIATQQAESETSGADRRAGIEADIADVRKHIEQCSTAQSQFARIRENKRGASQKLAEARARWQTHETEMNPFKARAAEQEARVGALRATIERDDAAMRKLAHEYGSLTFWETGFSSAGIPVLVLRLALFDLETYANRFLAKLTEGRIWSQLSINGDDLAVKFFKREDDGVVRERDYLQLSGGERRCAEMAFAPFALSEMIFARCGVRVGLLIIDELTTHLGAEEKPIVCGILRDLDRETVLVIDHDASVRGSFDRSIVVTREPHGMTLSERGVDE